MLHVAKMCLIPRDYFKIKSIVTVAITKASNRIKEAQAKKREKKQAVHIFFLLPFSSWGFSIDALHLMEQTTVYSVGTKCTRD